MKKVLIAILALAALSCARLETNAAQNTETLTISAGFEDRLPLNTTKTYLAGNAIRWSAAPADKQLLVIDTKGGKHVFTSTSGQDEAVRTFSGTIGQGTKVRHILWTGGEVSADGSVLSMPNPQTIGHANSFADGANIAIMKPSDAKLRNVLGYIRFVIPAGADGNAAISAVTISADEALTGDITIDYEAEEPVATIVSAGSKSLTVNCHAAYAAYAVLVPGTYHNMKLTVTPVSGEPFTLSCQGEVKVLRGRYTSAGTLPAVKPEDPSWNPDAGYVLGEKKLLAAKSGGPLHIDGDALYAGASGIVRIYDISQPFFPELKKELSFVGLPRQIRVYNDRLFITARETGTWIYDVQDRFNPVLLSHYDGVELATGLDVAGDCMFIGMRQMGVEFVDISDITRPQHINIIQTGESQSVFYVDGYLYSAEWTTGEVSVFKADNLADIRKLKTVKLWGSTDGIWVTGNRLYASTGHNPKNNSPYMGTTGNGHGVEIWDISDRANPVRISECRFPIFYKAGADWWQNRPSGDCKTLFCCDVFNGFYVVDISDEAHPTIIDSWVDTSAPKGDNKPVESVAVGDGVLYMSCGGLYMIDCPRANRSRRNQGVPPTGSSARRQYPTPADSHFNAWVPSRRGAVRDAAVSPDGSALFVGCGQAGLATLKLGADGKPYAVSELALPFAGGVSVLGNRLYVSEAERGVGVYKIGPDLSLTLERYILNELGNEVRFRYSCWLSTPNDKYLASANRHAGWQYIAIGGTEDAPTYTFRGSKSTNVNYAKYIAENVCAGDKLAYATRSSLTWIDLSSTAGVSYTSFSNLQNGIPDGVTEFKNGTALLTQSKSFKTVASGAGEILASSGTLDCNLGIPRWDGGDKVLVTDHVHMTVGLFNLADVTSPVKLFSESMAGHPEPGLFWHGKAVVPCGYQGLLLEK